MSLVAPKFDCIIDEFYLYDQSCSRYVQREVGFAGTGKLGALGGQGLCADCGRSVYNHTTVCTDVLSYPQFNLVVCISSVHGSSLSLVSSTSSIYSTVSLKTIKRLWKFVNMLILLKYSKNVLFRHILSLFHFVQL